MLALRRGKGMVVDPADPDSVSAGSFFTNPVLDGDAFAALERRVAERLGHGVAPPAFREPDGRVKTSAAWLIERAGFHRGQGDPHGIAISAKHTLALTNRGAGTTAELVALAREIAGGRARRVRGGARAGAGVRRARVAGGVRGVVVFVASRSGGGPGRCACGQRSEGEGEGRRPGATRRWSLSYRGH